MHGKGWQLQGQGVSGSRQGERLAVERAILHRAEMTRVGTLAPFYLQSRVITCPSAVLQRDRSAYLGEILRASGLAVYVAITEYCSHLMVGGIEWFTAEQRKAAFVIYSRTA